MKEAQRLNVFISSSGYCSRRKADELIVDHKVLVNSELATLGTRVLPSDTVIVEGHLIRHTQERIVLVYHKPIGVSSSTDPKDKSNVISTIKYPQRIFPIGRLDKDSEGLLLLTNDGDLVNQILRSENNHEKEYLVKTKRPFEDDFLTKLSEGIQIYNPVTNAYVVTKRCDVKRVDTQHFSIVLTQGYNRQIRRMVSALGHQVVYLKRTRIMHITLGTLKKGTYRILSANELSKLDQSLKKTTP